MVKKKVWKSNRTWTKKDYYRFAQHEADEKILDFLVLKILSSKALSLKDAKEFLRLHLKHLAQEMQGYEYVKGKDAALSTVIRETYQKKAFELNLEIVWAVVAMNVEPLKRNLLFVCTRNLNRSKAFESRIRELMINSGFEIRSAGTLVGYPYQVNNEILDWAKTVYVMDLSQEMFIKEHYPKYVKKVKIIGVSDEYDRDDESLQEIIDYWFKTRFEKYMLG